MTPELTDISKCKFERLDDVIQRLNQRIRSGGINGNIITIESLQCNASIDWKIDSQTSLTTFTNKIVFILRIFYQNGGPPCDQEIGKSTL